MNELLPASRVSLPALVTAAGDRAGVRFLEFFAAQIRNPHTRRAYGREREIPGGVVGKLGAGFGNLLTWLNFINCESCSVA